MSSFDLKAFAERMTKAAERGAQLKVSVSATDLILSRDGGFGVGRSESVPFPALFLRDDDPLDQALARLEAGGPTQSKAA